MTRPVPAASARRAWLSLLVLQIAWFGWWAPVEALGRIGGAALALVPLLASTRGVLAGSTRGLVVGGLILLFYFCIAVAEAWASPAARIPALIQIALIGWYYRALAGIRRGEPA